jgi:ferrous iron transport protein A
MCRSPQNPDNANHSCLIIGSTGFVARRSIWPPVVTSTSRLTLAQLPHGRSALVHAVQAPADQPEWAAQLADLGFVAGERVRVMVRGVPGGDPLVVRVGVSTYALRRAEAECVRVDPSHG